MRKNFFEEVNEIGKEIGYPFVISKNGTVVSGRLDFDYSQLDDVAMVVYAPVDAQIFDIPKTENGIALSKLIPFSIVCESTVLNAVEQKQFILRGKRSEIVSYYKNRMITPRVASFMVARNEVELYYKLVNEDNRLPANLAYAIASQMYDGSFVDFISKAHAYKIKRFSEKAERYLLLNASDEKFKAYVEKYGLCYKVQGDMVNRAMCDRLKIYVAAGNRLDAKIEKCIRRGKILGILSCDLY